MSVQDVRAAIRSHATAEQKRTNQWFFKTGPGEYGEGDQFLGVRVPPLRKIARQYKDLPYDELMELLRSPFHEERLAALLIMVLQFESARDEYLRETLYNAYLKALDEGSINNWDLVDASAHKIVGAWLFDKKRDQLFELARSKRLWHERVAMIACFHFIQQNDFKDALKVAKILVHHKHDLIHKAVGWMLREIGKRNQAVEEKFLKKYQKTMPRTMLRYAIERFDEDWRQKYLKGIA